MVTPMHHEWAVFWRQNRKKSSAEQAARSAYHRRPHGDLNLVFPLHIH